MAQSVARRLGKAEVTGSSPANSFKERHDSKIVSFFFHYTILSAKNIFEKEKIIYILPIM